MYNEIFQPVLEELKYQITRSDKIPSPGLITKIMIRHLIESDIVIADISGYNPNVMYELGIRHTKEKPVILVTSDIDKEFPFDIRDIRILEIDLKNQSYDKFKNDLKSYIINAEIYPVSASESIVSQYCVTDYDEIINNAADSSMISEITSFENMSESDKRILLENISTLPYKRKQKRLDQCVIMGMSIIQKNWNLQPSI